MIATTLHHKTLPRGFSLIELMIVIAIIGLLTVIAVPSYQQYVLRANRIDATSHLLNIATEQEKYYLQNNTYTDDLTDLGLHATESPEGYYTMAVTAVGGLAAGFRATATVDAGERQAEDAADCNAFTLDNVGVRGATSTNGLTVDRCWGQ